MQFTFDAIDVILLKTIQYIASQLLQMRWPVILAVVVCRHGNQLYKLLSIIFRRPYNAFSYNCLYIISIIILICITMCSYENAKR